VSYTAKYMENAPPGNELSPDAETQLGQVASQDSSGQCGTPFAVGFAVPATPAGSIPSADRTRCDDPDLDERAILLGAVRAAAAAGDMVRMGQALDLLRAVDLRHAGAVDLASVKARR
jgi:hypothetical protein